MKNRLIGVVALMVAMMMAPMMSAQITHRASGDVDETADALLKRAAAKLTAKAVSFHVTMINKDTDKRETARMEANVVYSKGRYRVEHDRNVLYCDGAALWHWNKDAGEVTINPIDDTDDDDLLNPAKLLENYAKNYKAKYIRTDNDGMAVVDLSPRKGMSYHKIRMVVEEQSGIVKSMELHNYDGSRGLYEVSRFRQGVKVSDKDFAFDRQANPAVEVIDMR